MEFTIESLQFSSLRASIYRLHVQMSVWLKIPRYRLDGRHKASGRTAVQSAFQILLKFFPELSCVRTVLPCRPYGHTLAARNFHIKTWHIRTIRSVIQTIDLMHTISIYDARTSGSWRLTSGCLDFECTTCLMDERIQIGIHIVRMVAAVFPYLCFGKKSHSWSNTKWRPDVLLKRPNGCKLEQFEAFRHRGRFGLKVLIVQTDVAWTVERPDGISRRLYRCKGSDFFDLESVHNLLETYLWRRLMKTD